MLDPNATILLRPGNELTALLKNIAVSEVDRLVSLAQVAKIESESDAGFSPRETDEEMRMREAQDYILQLVLSR